MSGYADLPRTDSTRRPPTWLLRGGRPVGRFLVRRRFGVRLHGVEHVPTRGPVILAGNHIGIVDGPLLAAFSPRPVHALTKIEMFTGRTGRFLTAAGQIPIDRFAPDPAAIRTCVRVLRDGRVVGIFPEGTRGAGDLGRFHRGAAYLALVTGAPVVPLAFLGTREYGAGHNSFPPRRSRLVLSYGEPRSWPRQEWPRRRQDVREVAEEHRAMLVALLHDAMAATGIPLPGPIPPVNKPSSPNNLKDHP